MIEIEIDGKKIEAQPGAMIIQAADEHGIYIPRFCYHKKLSIAANCRMCLVEVEKAPKTLPACATPVAPGMKVFTQSEKTMASQRSVMEFLLVNHPLDCPICDQGGECELQDLSMGYGRGISRYNQGKRSVKDKNLGPLIASEMTRCIQCTRCVRFGNEVAGMPELGATGRGELLESTTYVEHTIKSEISGNMVDICPVGALTNKPYRFTARAWEMRQHPAIAPHDCLGSNIFIHTRGEEYSPIREVMRVVPRENEAINETWLSDRDRYSYEAVRSPERLLQPLIKREQGWEQVDWDTALQEIKSRIQAIIRESGGQAMAALASPSTTVEEGYLLQKLFRELGIPNLDYRIHQTDFRSNAGAHDLGLAIAELEQLDTLLLVGSNVRQEQPLANQRIRKAAVKNNAKVMCVNPIDYPFNYALAEKQIVGGGSFVLSLAKILKSLQNKKQTELPQELIQFLATIEPGEVEMAMAEQLLTAKNAAVFLGAYALNHSEAAVVHCLAQNIAQCAGVKFGVFTEGANARGLSLAGMLPQQGVAGSRAPMEGLDAKAMFLQGRHGYLLWNIDPELDLAYSAAASKALSAADLVIAISSFRSDALEKSAHIILPLAVFAETAASYVNVEGRWQSMNAATLPLVAARPGWQVLRDLAQAFALSGFSFQSAAEVRDELLSLMDKVLAPAPKVPALTLAELNHSISEEKLSTLSRVGAWPMYRVDSTVRHAEALQATLVEDVAMVGVHFNTARRLNLEAGALVTAIQGESRVSLPLLVDDGIGEGQVVIYSGLRETAGFGEAFGAVELKRGF